MKGSPLEFALVGLLKQQPQSGYDLRKTFANTPMRHFSDSPGSIYPALQRLRSRKWIQASQAATNARQRQVFRLTRAGEAAFLEWLRQPITRDDVIWGVDELLLRFAFLDGNVPRPTTLKFVEEFERELVAYIAELTEFQRTFGAGISGTTGAMAFDNGIQQYKAHLSWVRGARQQLAEETE